MKGKREYVQVLRLLETFSLNEVAAAVEGVIARGVIGFDAVKHLVLCRIERRPPRLNMLSYRETAPAGAVSRSHVMHFYSDRAMHF